MFPENELRFLSFGFPPRGPFYTPCKDGYLFLIAINWLYFANMFSIRDHISRNSIIKTKWLNKSNKFALRKAFIMHTQTIFELSQEAERLLQLALQNLETLKSMPGTMLDSATAALRGGNNNCLLYTSPSPRDCS